MSATHPHAQDHVPSALENLEPDRPAITAPPRSGTVDAERAGRRAVLIGRVLSGIAVLFLGFDAGMKLLQVAPAVQGTTQLGYPAGVLFPLGLTQAACLALYLAPRTSVLGAVLWTGYLGGAVATHVRVGGSLFGEVLFPVYVALLLWGGLWLREPRLRALLPLRSAGSAEGRARAS